MTSIYLIDDHEAVRQGYTLLIRREADMQVVGESNDGSLALQQVEQLQPDIVVLDISLQGPLDGADLLQSLRRQDADLAILVVSGHDEMVYAERMLRLGARGYVMKGDALTFLHALRQVAQGNTYVSEHVRSG
jgi:DNA-binding NarL/FixJ family response regulator